VGAHKGKEKHRTKMMKKRLMVWGSGVRTCKRGEEKNLKGDCVSSRLKGSIKLKPIVETLSHCRGGATTHPWRVKRTENSASPEKGTMTPRGEKKKRGQRHKDQPRPVCSETELATIRRDRRSSSLTSGGQNDDRFHKRGRRRLKSFGA